MAVSDWLVVVSLWKVEWRSALEESGELCVMTCGTTEMPEWSAGSLDYHLQVCKFIIVVC